MILHIVVDDKFIDTAYQMFEKVYPGQNKFMIISNKKEFKFIKKTPIEQINFKTFLTKAFIDSLSQYEFVVIHWLDVVKLEVIRRSPSSIKFLWIGWGGDYYDFINLELYLPETKKLLKKLGENRDLPLLSRTKLLIMKLYSKFMPIKKIINKISYFSPVLRSEYPLVANSFTEFRAKYLDWNYGTLEELIGTETDEYKQGKNILFGNSATFENNHIDLLPLLSTLNFSGRRLIMPLSYGDSNYATYITSTMLKNNIPITPLLNFMPLEEYNQIIFTCSIVIMNHKRQQGLGNIVALMYRGAKIFLNEDNPVYQYYKEKGAILFSINELNNKSIALPLSKKEIETNRKILKENLSAETMIKKTRNLIEIMRD